MSTGNLLNLKRAGGVGTKIAFKIRLQKKVLSGRWTAHRRQITVQWLSRPNGYIVKLAGIHTNTFKRETG